MRLSARSGEQVFLSSHSAVHGQWIVAGGDDGKENATAIVILVASDYFSALDSIVKTKRSYFSPNHVIAVSFPLSIAAMRAYPCCQSWLETSPVGEVTTLKGRGMVSP